MHKKRVISNSLIGIINKIIILILGFISRKVFIVYLGEELLGLNSLYSNLLELLNLADLGIGISLQYQLFEPLVKNDKEKLSKIISVAKKVYNMIGCVVLVAGAFLSLFIQYLIKSTTYPMSFVRISFLIGVVGIALSYFFVHKRLFFQANEQLGLVDTIDIFTRIVVISLSLVATAVFRNYYLYLCINIFYTIISNTFVHFAFNKFYPDIDDKRGDYDAEKKELVGSLRDVIPLKLTNYIYYSTDNIIISKVIGLTTVALYTNYMTIINGVMGIEYIYGSAITSSMGKIIKENKDLDEQFNVYLAYQYTQFVITNFAMCSLWALCTPFIRFWLGERFVLSNYILLLLIFDFFIHSMYQPAAVMYGAIGIFKKDKIVTWISAVLNIVVSLILVQYIGLAGVIVGTFVTDIYILFARSYQIVCVFYKKPLFKYILRMLLYVVIVAICLIVVKLLCDFIVIDNLFVEIMIKGIVCVLVPNIICLICTFYCVEFKYIRLRLMRIFRRKN